MQKRYRERARLEVTVASPLVQYDQARFALLAQNSAAVAAGIGCRDAV
jgi:hypothetical protein